ncbi:hypothetical protein LXA43DRAFT_1067666 [Ganoderma leucocontextum]|nr:hypothetical protein LXA43DRAFT_1067666 [Ganoderma leucocontextum]
MTGPEIDTMAHMPVLGPMEKLKGWAAKPVPALSPSLAELVITCGFAVRPTATAPKPKGRAVSSRSGSRVDLNTTVNKRDGGTKKSAEATPVWPTPAARQSVLQTRSLQELVDGPVTLKLLDRAGAEIDIDKAEA